MFTFVLTGGESGIPSVAYEEELIRLTDSYLRLLSHLDIEPPIIVMLSMVGVKGFRMIIEQRYSFRRQMPVVDRDTLLLPEVVLQDYGEEPATVLRPIFDAVWQSAGFERSLNYDVNGHWSSRH